MEKFPAEQKIASFLSNYRIFALIQWLIIALIIFATTWTWWHSYRPSLKVAPDIGALNISLNSHAGPIPLTNRDGKLKLLYFGYTHCVNACPLTLHNWAAAFELLDEQERTRVQGIMISLDPARDTQSLLNEYTSYFHHQIAGATATPEQLEQLVTAFQIYYQTYNDATGNGYSIDHTANTYIIDDTGKLVKVIAYGGKGDKTRELVKTIRQALG